MSNTSNTSYYISHRTAFPIEVCENISNRDTKRYDEKKKLSWVDSINYGNYISTNFILGPTIREDK